MQKSKTYHLGYQWEDISHDRVDYVTIADKGNMLLIRFWLHFCILCYCYNVSTLSDFPLSLFHTHILRTPWLPNWNDTLCGIEIWAVLISSPWRLCRIAEPRPVCWDEAPPSSTHSSGLSPHEIPLHQINLICVFLFRAIKCVCMCRVKWDHLK